MAEQTVQDRYHQLVDSVSDLVSGSTTSLTTIELALDDMLLKLKLWGLDVGEANGTLQNIDEKDPLLAGIIRDVFESLSEAIHALRFVNFPCEFQVKPLLLLLEVSRQLL
jgi:hypothetical protein